MVENMIADGQQRSPAPKLEFWVFPMFGSIWFCVDWISFRPPTKFREGNDFSRVCHSLHKGVPYNHYPWCIGPHHTGTPCTGPQPLLYPTDHCKGTPKDMFKLVHYATRTVSKRVLGTLLEYFHVCGFSVSHGTLWCGECKNKTKDHVLHESFNHSPFRAKHLQVYCFVIIRYYSGIKEP